MFLRSSDLIMRMVHNVIAKLSYYEIFSIDVQRYRFPVGSLRWLKTLHRWESIFFFPILSKHVFFYRKNLSEKKWIHIHDPSILYTDGNCLPFSFFLASTKILFVILKPIREKSVLNRDKNLNRNYHLKTQHLATQQ